MYIGQLVKIKEDCSFCCVDARGKYCIITKLLSNKSFIVRVAGIRHYNQTLYSSHVIFFGNDEQLKDLFEMMKSWK